VKILLVYPDVLLHRRDWPGYFYVGLATLSSVLKEAGHQTSLMHVTRPIGRDEFVSRVKEETADLIGYSATSHMFPFVKQFAAWLKDAGVKTPSICGGIHPTIAPDKTLAAEGVDMVCQGEGEEAIRELCQRLDHGTDHADIPNIWVKRNGDTIRNPLGPLVSDLDVLPFPDRSIFDYRNLYGEREGRASFLVSRGCPYNCTYCCNHLRRKIYPDKGGAVRFRSVEHVIREIKAVREHYPFIRSLIFDDDILFLKKDWAQEFADRYSKEVALPFTCNARANLIDENTTDLLAKAGCSRVKFGLENGNEYIVNQVLDRRLSNDQVRNAFRLCKEAGMVTESFNMVGVPFETPSTALDTVKLNAEIGVDSMQVTIFQPYFGTTLAELCRERGFVQGDELEADFFSPSIVKLDTISSAQVLMFRDYFKILVRYYQMLQSLPGVMSRPLVWLSDRLLSWKPTARIANIAYVPMNHVFRRLQTMKMRTKVAGLNLGNHYRPVAGGQEA